MFIGGHDLPCIGLIRPKELCDGRVMLTIYPPGPGALAGAGAATMVEIVVAEAEVRRIEETAPHLMAKRPLSQAR